MRVALLAGGTGGAKLGAGMQEEIGAELTVIANTADDVETFGVHVSPDPDLVTYWLSGEIDAERGWGIRDDTFTVFERMTKLGAPDWFGLSDRDLAACLYRRDFLDAGGRLTDAQAQIARALGVAAGVLPMCDTPVRTKVRTAAGTRGLQEYLIVDRGEPEVLGVELEGIAEAEASPEVVEALGRAEAIVIGPSNPVISIGPILAVPGVREAIAASGAPVVAVSPFVAGKVVKGPTDRFMAAIGRPSTAAGVASLYAGIADAMVVDEDDPDPPPTEIPTLATATLMEGAPGRARLARIVLDYASDLIASRMDDSSSLAGVKATAIVPVKRFHEAKQRLAPGIDEERRMALAVAMLEDVLEAIAAARTIERTIVVRATRPPRRSPPPPPPRSSPTPPTRAMSRRRSPASPAPKSRAPSASSCSPATARCSTRASSTGC